MKQDIFIVEQFQTPNNLKLPKDFVKFPFGKERVNVQKQLYNLSKISVGACKNSGLFIFTLDKEQCKLTFSWLSLPTFAASLRLVMLICMTIYHHSYHDLIDEHFKSTSNLSVYIFTILLTYPNLFQILQYVFYHSLLSFFDWSFPIFTLVWFAINFRRFHYSVVQMTIIDKFQFGFRTVKEHVLEFVRDGNNPNVRDITVNNAFGRLQGDKGGDDITVTDYLREVKLNQIVEKYRAMEELVAKFNGQFSSHLMIGIGSLLIIMLMMLFHLFVEINGDPSTMLLVFATNAVMNMWVLHSLGTSATNMANEAEECIIVLRDVPIRNINPVLKQKIMLHFQQALAVPLVISPGNFFSLNRQMITSVAGTLTTYLIVLIQFQSTENGKTSIQNVTSLNGTLFN